MRIGGYFHEYPGGSCWAPGIQANGEPRLGRLIDWRLQLWHDSFAAKGGSTSIHPCPGSRLGYIIVNFPRACCNKTSPTGRTLQRTSINLAFLFPSFNPTNFTLLASSRLVLVSCLPNLALLSLLQALPGPILPVTLRLPFVWLCITSRRCKLHLNTQLIHTADFLFPSGLISLPSHLV